ncbi:MAG: trigger factor [Campylobacteraceae bacterium]
MEVKVTKINSANASASAKIDSKKIEEKQDKILKSLAKNVHIDGFRKGKVPASVVKARYAEKVKQDAEQEAIKELYDLTVKELSVDESKIIGEPHFTKFDRREDGIDVELKISLRPEINLDGYEKCIPEYKTPRVAKEEVDERVNSLLKSNAPLKKVTKKRALAEGDFALIDFEGFVDDKAFEGGASKGYVLEIGSKSFIPGFEDGMVGMNVDETRDVKVKFPEEYGNKELAGKDATFKVTLHEIQERDVPKEVDADTLKKFLPGEEQPTLEKLEDRIKEQIRNEKLSKLYNEELKPKFVDDIVKAVNFDLPDNIVEQEMDVLFRNIFRSISEEDMEAFKNDPKKVTEKRETFRNDAQSSVKLTFIVDELARLKNVTVSDQEVMQMIYFEAMQYGQDPKQHIENYKQQGVLPAIKMAMIEDKLFGSLFAKTDKEDDAKSSEEKTSKPKAEKKVATKEEKAPIKKATKKGE